MLPLFRPFMIAGLVSAGLVGCVLFPQGALAKEYVVGLSPYLKPEQAQRESRVVAHHLISTLQPGDEAVVMDAYHLRTIARFQVPNKPIYNTLKIKLKTNAQAVAALNRFAAAAQVPNKAGEPQKPGALKIPEFLRFVGSTYPAHSVDILLFGSPLYPAPQSPGFSMESGLIPGDGHLFHSVGSTPFGVDNPQALRGKRLYWYTGGTHWALHEQHRWHVERFWSLFCSKQGGMLVSFHGDLATVLTQAKAHRATPQNQYGPISPGKKKLEMIRVRTPQQNTNTSIYERPISQDKPPAALVKQAENVEFGIQWQCNQCDLDLYVRPTPTAEVLYFGKRQSPYGAYLKDYLSSPKNFFETVQLKKPVDLNKTLVAVNYYSSPFFAPSPGPVKGEMRISWQGRTYRKAFLFTMSGGNLGWQRQDLFRTGQAPSPHWIVFNLSDILGI
jgi:hypothetical protein